MYRTIFVAIGVLVATTTLGLGAQQAARPPALPRTSARAGVPSGSVVAPSAPVSRLLPGTRPNVFAFIQGNALNSTYGELPNTIVRLRDARAGGILDTQVTDKSGLFAFRPIDPGAYVVEIVGNDQTILAASQMLIVGAGEAVSAIVKLPFRISPLAGYLGHTVQSATAVSAAAAASGVLAATVTTQITPQ